MAIDSTHLAVLRTLRERLDSLPCEWAITGSLGLALRGIDIAVRDVDVRTDRAGAQGIACAFADSVDRPVTFTSSESIRSHFGSLRLEGIAVEIMGDMRQRLADGTWEDADAWRRHVTRVEVAGLLVPVLSLAFEREMYARLGRTDKVDLIRRALDSRAASPFPVDRPAPRIDNPAL